MNASLHDLNQTATVVQWLELGLDEARYSNLFKIHFESRRQLALDLFWQMGNQS